MFKNTFWKFEWQTFPDFKNTKMLSMKHYDFFLKCPQIHNWCCYSLFLKNCWLP